MKPRVFVTRAIPDGGLAMIRQAADMKLWEEELPPPRERLLAEAREAEGLLSLLTDRVDAELMDGSPRLRVVSNYAVGFDNIDVRAATERGIPVGNTPGVLTETTADLAFALLMAAARRVVEGVDYVRAGKWKDLGAEAPHRRRRAGRHARHHRARAHRPGAGAARVGIPDARPVLRRPAPPGPGVHGGGGIRRAGGALPPFGFHLGRHRPERVHAPHAQRQNELT